MADDTTDPDAPTETAETAGEGATEEVTQEAPADAPAADADTETDDTDTGTGDADTGAGDTADKTESGPTDSPAPAATAAAGSSAWQRVTRIAAVAAVYVVLAALAGVLGWKLWADHRVDRAGRIAQDTAVNYAQVLTSISSGEVDDNFAAVLNGATGDFKDMYTESSMRLRQLLIDSESAADGKVVDSAIQSETLDKVVVLLMVDQKVENTELPDPRVDSLRMKMTMERVDGRWLASKVELP